MSRPDTVISFSPKVAALYFPKVVPIGLQNSINVDLFANHSHHPTLNDALENSELGALSPDELYKNSNLVDSLLGGVEIDRDCLMDASGTYAVANLFAVIKDIRPDAYDELKSRERVGIRGMVERLGHNIRQISQDPLLSGSVCDLRLSVFGEECALADADSTALVLASSKLVDVSNADWSQILEFRKDDQSRLSFLNFRKFFFDELSGLDGNEIFEELERLKLEYEVAASKHGFEMTLQDITSIATAKAISNGTLAGVVAATLGLGTGALVVGAIPPTLEVGSLCLKLVRRKHEMRSLRGRFPISYLSDIESKLATKKK